MALLATCFHVFPTCFLHFGGKPSGNGNDGATSYIFPTCFPHFGGKPRTGNGNEGAPDALLTGKGTEGVLLPAYPTIWTGNRKWWRFWPEFLTAQGILLSWLSVCKLSADYLSREPVGIWPIPWSSLGEQEDSFRSLIIITKTNSFTSFIKAEIIMISCLNYFGRHLINCLFPNSDNYIA